MRAATIDELSWNCVNSQFRYLEMYMRFCENAVSCLEDVVIRKAAVGWYWSMFVQLMVTTLCTASRWWTGFVECLFVRSPEVWYEILFVFAQDHTLLNSTKEKQRFNDKSRRKSTSLKFWPVACGDQEVRE